MEKKRERSVPFTGSAYFKRNIGTIIGLILLIIIVSISTPKFMTSSNLLNLLKSNSVNAIICCGMLLAILMGEIDISVGSTVGLTGVIGAWYEIHGTWTVQGDSCNDILQVLRL